MINKTVTIDRKFEVKRIGLGTNRIQDNEQSKQALLKAIELGINFIDTAAAYTAGESEKTIGDTLYPYPNGLIIATKGGLTPPNFSVDGRTQTLEKQLKSSLETLKVETIDLYFLHRVDPNVPFEDQIGFLKQAKDDGKIKHIGLSEVSVEQIVEARKIVEIVAVENEYNLSERKHDDVLDYCEREGIVFVPFYPLHGESTALPELQSKYDATREQIILAWLLKSSPAMLPIPGSLSPKHLEENFKALNIELSEEDFVKLS